MHLEPLAVRVQRVNADAIFHEINSAIDLRVWSVVRQITRHQVGMVAYSATAQVAEQVLSATAVLTAKRISKDDGQDSRKYKKLYD